MSFRDDQGDFCKKQWAFNTKIKVEEKHINICLTNKNGISERKEDVIASWIGP